MVIAHRPQTYTVELDFLEAWEILNSLLERRARLDVHGEPTLTTLNVRAEDKLREAIDLPADIDAPWSESELRFAHGDR